MISYVIFLPRKTKFNIHSQKESAVSIRRENVLFVELCLGTISNFKVNLNHIVYARLFLHPSMIFLAATKQGVLQD